MSNDRIQHQMDFILEQQARFHEEMIKLEETTRQNTEDITRLVGAVMNLTLHAGENSQRIAELAARGLETDARLKETGAHLNTLITVVERYFSNGEKR